MHVDTLLGRCISRSTVVYLQHIGALTHCSCMIRIFVSYYFPSHWIGYGTLHHGHPDIQASSSCDFYPWWYMADLMHQQKWKQELHWFVTFLMLQSMHSTVLIKWFELHTSFTRNIRNKILKIKHHVMNHLYMAA
jgi:hypothetical protein